MKGRELRPGDLFKFRRHSSQPSGEHEVVDVRHELFRLTPGDDALTLCTVVRVTACPFWLYLTPDEEVSVLNSSGGAPFEPEGRLTLDSVKAWVDQVFEHARCGDLEMAHHEQDRMMAAVLKAVAEGYGRPQDLAACALGVESADLPRWCA